MRKLYAIFLFLSCCLIPLISFSQTNLNQGNLFIQNYNHKDYDTPENQTWAILQDQDGIMYFGNNSGVLEFDGNYWRLIELSNKSVVRSLALDKRTNRIYVGGVGELGYLQHDSTGILHYISMISKIPEEYRNFEDVWHIAILNNQVIFRTVYAVFILKNDKFFIIKPTKNRFHTSFCVNGQYYIREWGTGLYTLIDDKLHHIGQSEIFANERIYSMVPYETNKILIVTRTQGIYIYTPNSLTNRFIKPNKFEKINTFLTKNQTYYGIQLTYDRYVIGTIQDGLLIFNKDGKIIRHINKQSGMLDDDVLSIYSDLQDNIWVGLNNGISYLIFNSPFTIYNENNGLKGTVYNTIIYKNILYTGTSLGVYIKDSSSNFSLVKSTQGQNWNLCEINGDLLLAHADGVFKIKNNVAEKIILNEGAAWNINKIANKSYLFVGTDNGIILLEYVDNNWKLKHKVKGFNESARYIEIDDNTLWISHPNKGVYKAVLNEELDSIIKIDFFDTNDGLPSNTNNYVYKIKSKNQTSKIIFGTEQGIYKYDNSTNTFIPDKNFEILLKNKGSIDKFTQDPNGNIYFQQGKNKGILYLQEDGTYKPDNSWFLKLQDLYVENISILDSTTISFCSRDGLVLCNLNIHPDYGTAYKTIIRDLYIRDSLIFHGSDTIFKKTILPFKDNDVKFTFSALYYENHDKNEYSFYLEGYKSNEQEWSKFSDKTEKEYTNLHEGLYTFRVKARNVFGKESPSASYTFEILPPWYRTVLAYIIYILLSVLLIGIIVRLYTLRLKKEKDILEEVVRRRTKDLHEINTQLEENQADLEVKQEEITAQSEHLYQLNTELQKHKHQLQDLVDERTSELLAAKVKAEEADRLKSAFLANMSHEIRTPMNAIVGFSNILEDSDIKVNERKNIIYHINHNCNTLLHLIDDIIDISKIEAGQLNLNKIYCDIHRILDELLDTFNEHKQIIQKQNIEIILHKESSESNFLIYTDPIRLQQVLSNLIDNALKYTEEGSIDFGYKIKENTRTKFIEFFVKDTGIGLTKDQYEIIFSRFTKIETNKKKIYRGAGLGLAISQNIVNLLGGKIWVNSKINKGSTFYFTIPYIKEKDTIQDKKSILKDKIDSEWPGKTILIAEDEESNFLYFKMLLSKTKTNIIHADNGEKVLEIWRNNKVDLILMDIKMPILDGLEVTKLIRKENKTIPIIAVTAFAMEDDEKLCKEAGCNSYMQKPIQKTNLIRIINSFLSTGNHSA